MRSTQSNLLCSVETAERIKLLFITHSGEPRTNFHFLSGSTCVQEDTMRISTGRFGIGGKFRTHDGNGWLLWKQMSTRPMLNSTCCEKYQKQPKGKVNKYIFNFKEISKFKRVDSLNIPYTGFHILIKGW